MVHLRPHFCANKPWAIAASARCGTCSASPLPSRRQIKGHNCSPVDHSDAVIPNIANAHLALRPHFLQIFPSFDRCFFQGPIRAALAIYLDFETSTEVVFGTYTFLHHLRRSPSLPSLLSRPQRHAKCRCLLIRSPLTPLKFACDHTRICFLARERLEGPHVFLRPQTKFRSLLRHLYSPHTDVPNESATTVKQKTELGAGSQLSSDQSA
jgi:hypothetical protein